MLADKIVILCHTRYSCSSIVIVKFIKKIYNKTSYLNSIYLYDDKIIIDCNYKEGTETITLEEIESSALGSDLTSVGAPSTKSLQDLTVSH